MILPIYAYGHQILLKQAVDVALDDDQLKPLIDDMWETMYNANGVGLAGPQIGRSLKIFVIDTKQILDEKASEETGIKQVFINPKILIEEGDTWAYEEGCLSIPNIRGDVHRNESLTIEYIDEFFVKRTETFSGINARVIQHEYDHTLGKLFIDKLKPLKKKLIQRKLEKIRQGKINPEYKMKFG